MDQGTKDGLDTYWGKYSQSGSVLRVSEATDSTLGMGKEPENTFVCSESNGAVEEIWGGSRPCGCALQAEVDALKRREKVLVSCYDECAFSDFFVFSSIRLVLALATGGLSWRIGVKT